MVIPTSSSISDPRPQISTGIPGLDELLVGGLTPNRMYLIEGKPGSGKTTLALQFLLEGRTQGESTLYVTLSETTHELRAVAASHGWTLDGIETFQLAATQGMRAHEQYTLYHPAEVELGQTVDAVIEAIERLRPTRVVLDSLSELKLLAREPLRFRRQILGLKEFFSGRDCTVLLLDDHASPDEDLQLQSLSHGVVLLEQLPFEYGRARRRLRVVKYRGVAAIEGYHDFTIRRGGLVVFPQLVPSRDAPQPVEPVRSGLAELDQLVGGGLTSGTTTLFMGPAGSGKSTLAAQYLSAGTTVGPTAVYLFDERLRTFTARCDALGMRMSEKVAAGSIRVHQIEPGELSPGEFAHGVREAVENHGVRMVMIDSLNGYLHAIPQIDTPLARMHELLSYLNERNVSTMLVLAQYGLVGSTMSTPIDVSYLADCVVMLRFFEAEGAVRRAISVMKKRTGLHETTIRELLFGAHSVRVGQALTEFEGVLSGIPRYMGERPLMGDGKR